jgi:hypothetical protein
MKRRNFPQRPTTFPIQFVGEHNENNNRNSVLVVRERPCLPRTIFIMRKTSCLSATNGPVKSIRRILIFDDHPDSLRLIFGPPGRRAYHTPGDRASWQDFILPGMAILAGLIAMFWPLS